MFGDVAIGVVGALLVGSGATAVMDAWAFLQKKWFSVPSLDYRLVGRWLGHIPQGRFVHDGIGKAEPVAYETSLGWAAHYVIGMAFCAVLISIWGTDWLRHPTLPPALIVGIGSIVAPFFILQPALGAGFAAGRTPKPWLSRFRSLVAHTSFAVGLYLSALVFSLLIATLRT